MEINPKILAAFLAGTVFASACVYVGAVRPMQAQISRDQASMDALAKNNSQTTAQLEEAVARLGELQGELNARGAQPAIASAAPAGQGITGYDAINAVRPGLGTALQKAAPVINRAVQQWQASHQTTPSAPASGAPPITVSPLCRSLDETSAQRNLTDSEKSAYRTCWGSDPPTHVQQSHPTGDPGCTVVIAMVNNGESLSDVERAEYNRCTLQ